MAICFLLNFFSRRVSFLGKSAITGGGEIEGTISSILGASILIVAAFMLGSELVLASTSTFVVLTVVLVLVLVLVLIDIERVEEGWDKEEEGEGDDEKPSNEVGIA